MAFRIPKSSYARRSLFLKVREATPRAALLGAQDRERAREVAQESTAESQARVAGNLDGRNQGHRRTGVRCIRGELRSEIREGGGLPEPGSRCAARLLRLPGRTLETPADYQSH